MIIGIDVETANSTAGAVCALGIAVVQRGAVVRDAHWLVNPGGTFDARYIQIHGITASAVRGRPSIVGIWPEVLQFLERAKTDFAQPRLFDFIPPDETPVTFVAHNAPFDRGQLESALGMALPFHLDCTVAMSRKAFPQLPRHNLSTVAAHLGIPLKHHDALSDARACALIAARC